MTASTAPAITARLPISAYFGKKLVSRSEVLACEAKRAARQLKRLDVALPEGDGSVCGPQRAAGLAG